MRKGYTKYDGVNDLGLLEYAVREDLNKRTTRVSAVLNIWYTILSFEI